MLTILKILTDGVVCTCDFVEAFLTLGYGASYADFNHFFKAKEKQRRMNGFAKEAYLPRENRAKFLSVISKLKREGFVAEEIKQGRKFISLTKNGRQKLQQLEEYCACALPECNYVLQPSEKWIIVAFDIPEKMRSKRDWFRGILLRLKFSLKQKSFWIGKTKIPRQLLEDLSELGMADYVEIFKVGKTGTLKELL